MPLTQFLPTGIEEKLQNMINLVKEQTRIINEVNAKCDSLLENYKQVNSLNKRVEETDLTRIAQPAGLP